MREIKCRAWDGEKWIYFSLISEGVWGVPNAIVDIKTISEYIGKKDENGKDIYEGDILEDGRGQYGKVFYSDKSASFLVNWKMEDGSWETDSCFYNVAGNFIENPELINQTK